MYILLLLSFAFVLTNSSKIPTAVLDLNEKFLDVMNSGYWFVKFYAPWCAHCKRLAPTWEHLGHALSDTNSQVRVGKVDCTRFPSVASALGITGYPTLIFFRKGVKIIYEGERKKKNMFEFAKKSAGPVVEKLSTLAHFYELRKTSDVEPFFIFVKNSDASSFVPANLEDERESDDNFTEKRENLPSNFLKMYTSIAEEFFTEVRFFTVDRSLISSAKNFVLPENQHLSSDFIFVVKDRRHVFFDVAEPENLRKWIEAERWPLISQISASNIYSIANSATKKLVVMVGDATEMITRQNLSTETGRFYGMFKRAANLSYYNDLLRENFQYGWTDEIALVKSIIMGEFSLPNVLVFNLSSYEFYINEDHPSQITELSMQTFLQRLVAYNVTAHGGRAWPTRFRRMFYEVTSNIHDMFYHQPILTVCLFGVPLAFFSIIFYSICSADFSVDRNEIYPEDENENYDGDYIHKINREHLNRLKEEKSGEESAWDEETGSEEEERDERFEQGRESTDSGTELIAQSKEPTHKKFD